MTKGISSGNALFELKVTLLDTDPPVWRRLRVPGSYHLGKLHRVVQVVMPWEESHLHQWEVGRRRFGKPDRELGLLDETRVTLEGVARKGSKVVYSYDFGDDWRHEVVVEDVVASVGPAKVWCLEGERACPPEDCGGPGGYANLLEALADPNHEAHDEMREWAGPDLDPARFDLQAAIARLRRMR